MPAKELAVPEIQDFFWSPAENIMSAFSYESGSAPSRIVLYNIPSMQLLRAKNLFNVSMIRMEWHPLGAYLGVKVDRHKSKKTIISSFELFRVKDRDVPVEVLELNEPVSAFAWEPKGHRFGLVTGERGQSQTVRFFSMLPQKGPKEHTLVASLEKRTVNALFWSPNGTYCVLAGLRASGTLLFFNVNDSEIMNEAEHYQCSNVEWDPSGRYLATWVSAHVSPSEATGTQIWGFTGRLMHKLQRDRFFQLAWRPRPPTLLSSKQEKEVRKGLNEASKRYTEEDEKRALEVDEETLSKRRAIMEAFAEGERRRMALYESQHDERVALGIISDGEDDEEFFEEEEEYIEVLSETTEVL